MAPEWTRALGRHNRGSRPRCVALVDAPPEDVAASLTDLVALPDAVVGAEDFWMPVGKPVKVGSRWDDGPAREARVDRDAGFLPAKVRAPLKDWWLAVQRGANTPNWDLASTCTIEGKQGLLLVEAKAHGNELSEAGKSLPSRPNGWKNHERIGQAIAKANSAFTGATGGEWSLSRDSHYQLSNRFAWAWKIASLGVPVILAYVGFLDAKDMVGDGTLFQTHEDWAGAVGRHAVGVVDASCWESRLDFQGVPFFALLRSRRLDLIGG